MPVHVAGLTVLLILVYGVVYQYFVFKFGKKGASAFTGFAFVFVFVPLMIAGMLKSMTPLNQGFVERDPVAEWLLSITPAAHFGNWLGRSDEKLHLAPVIMLYVAFLLCFWVVLRRSLHQLEMEVDGKLATMGVVRHNSPLPVRERGVNGS